MCSHNDLANPEVDVIEALLKRNVSINLESNPFSCTCDLLNFLDLYKAYKDKDSSLSTEMALQTGKGSKRARVTCVSSSSGCSG